MKVLIVGSGDILYFLSRNFTAKGHDVVIVDRNAEECVKLARQLNVTVICGDGSDANILTDAGAMGADVVLAVTPQDQDNLVICQISALRCGVPRTVALANDPDNVEVFERLGVFAFSTTQIISSLIEQRVSLEQITNLFPVGEGRVNVTEVLLDETSPVVGLSLQEANLPENALVAVILRNNLPMIPRGNSFLHTGDRVVLITLPENHGRVLRAFTGEYK